MGRMTAILPPGRRTPLWRGTAGAGGRVRRRSIMATVRLVLASASPRRAELLAAAGFVFDTLPVDIDERVAAGEDPAAYVQRLASEKSLRALGDLAGQAGVVGRVRQAAPVALAGLRLVGLAGPVGRVGQAEPVGQVGLATETGQVGQPGRVGTNEDAVVLGADTAVVVDGEIFGKP